jgi:hypothetical protein
MRPDQIGINNHHICSLGLSVFENDTGRSARIVVVDRSDWGRVMEVCSVGFGNLDQGIWDRVESAFWVPLFSQRLLLGAKSQRGRTIPSQVSVHCRSLGNQLETHSVFERVVTDVYVPGESKGDDPRYLHHQLPPPLIASDEGLHAPKTERPSHPLRHEILRASTIKAIQHV